MSNNVDNLLILGNNEEVKPDPIYVQDDTPAVKVKSEVEKEIITNQEDTKVSESEIEDKSSESLDTKEPASEESSDSEDLAQDEYGNDIPKPKTYTEKEVQKMIRDRLSRGNRPQENPHQQEQVNKAVKDFKVDESSDIGWEQQLEAFVEKTYEKITQKNVAKQQQERELRAQAEFESKFTTGMGKYPDFVDILQDKPVTDAMMMATRAMENPAAFIYAAAKNHAQDLERISKIADPFQQATEMGRLEERMKKVKAITRSPRSLESDKGDYNDKPIDLRPPIEQRIEEHARNRRR